MVRSAQYYSLFIFRYINNHLFSLFAGAWDPQPYEPLPVSVPQATDSEGNFMSR